MSWRSSCESGDAVFRVLIAEDSPTVRALLLTILDADPQIEVIGEAANGIQAVEMTMRLKPDVVTMDINMPEMDGFAATKEIMVHAPTPIVIVSGRSDVRDVMVSMQALRVGALAVLPKPQGISSSDFTALSGQFVETVKAMAEVKVVGHLPQRSAALDANPVIPPFNAPSASVITIVASTGGPAALHSLLAGMPGDFPIPILIVQHITEGYCEGLATWLDAASSLKVVLAVGGEPLKPQTAYIAPDNKHLGVSAERAIIVSAAPPIRGFRPSGTYLFESAAHVFGSSMIAVILTGMGDDGVAGLRAVREAGGRIIAQDEASSVVFGMPGAAVSAGLADMVMPLSAIAAQLGSRLHCPNPGT